MTDSYDSEPLCSAIDVKLKSIVEASPEKPEWYEAWSRLGPESTEEQRLAVYHAIRDSGVLPETAGRKPMGNLGRHAIRRTVE